MYDIIIKRENIHEENFMDRKQLNKINTYQKRDFSQDRKNIKTKIRTESSQIGNTNFNIDNFIYSDGNIANKNSKKKINKVKYINVNNFYKEVEYECEKKIDTKNIKENNMAGINTIIQNKEKAKTFNRQSSHKKIKNISDSYKNKINLISNDSKNKTEKNKIYSKKLITDNIIYSTNESNYKTKSKISGNINNVIFNSKHIFEPTNKNINSKRNTDSSIRILNKEILNNEKVNKSNKEKYNKVKAKINFSISSKNIKCIRQPENLKKNIICSNSFKKNISSIPINNQAQNNNLEELLKKRKNIDINTQYQINPSESIFNLENNKFAKNLNYTATNKVKLKTNNYLGNIEFEKEKERFVFNENNTITKSRSKVKKLENKKDPELEIRIIDKKRNENIIFNNKRKIINNSKVKNNDIYNKNLTEENPRDNYNKFELNKNNNLKNNNNSKLSKVKILPHPNEQINKNNTYKNNDSSFFTINFNNSNIDENNNNELKPNLGKYNFVNNIHNNENTYNFNITNRINNNNGNINDINNNPKSKVNDINVIKSNSNTNKNISLENFQISCENKNNFKNFNSNNNFSNCNTGNTSNNILNLNNLNNNINDDMNKNEKENFELEIKKKIIEENNNKQEKDKEEIVLMEFDEEKGPKDNYLKNYENKREIINFTNKKFMDDIKEKDISLDKSSSLKVIQVSSEEFIEKDDEVLKLLNSQSSIRDNNPHKIILLIFLITLIIILNKIMKKNRKL